MVTIRPMDEHEAEQALALWQLSVVEAIGHESDAQTTQRVLTNLRQYAGHPQCRCFLAVDEARVIGYVTCCISQHPVQPGTLGEIEELYVLPGDQRLPVSQALIAEAVRALKRLGARVIWTHVDVEDKAAIQLWHGLKWSQEMVNFAIYSDVPGDPDLQAVWDDYSLDPA